MFETFEMSSLMGTFSWLLSPSSTKMSGVTMGWLIELSTLKDCRRSLSRTNCPEGSISLESRADVFVSVLSRSDMIQDNFLTALDLLFFFLTEAKSQLGPSRGSASTSCSKNDSVNAEDWSGDGIMIDEGLGRPTGVVSVSRTYGEVFGNMDNMGDCEDER